LIRVIFSQERQDPAVVFFLVEHDTVPNAVDFFDVRIFYMALVTVDGDEFRNEYFPEFVRELPRYSLRLAVRLRVAHIVINHPF